MKSGARYECERKDYKEESIYQSQKFCMIKEYTNVKLNDRLYMIYYKGNYVVTCMDLCCE